MIGPAAGFAEIHQLLQVIRATAVVMDGEFPLCGDSSILGRNGLTESFGSSKNA